MSQNILTMNDEEFLKNIDNLPGETPAVVVAEQEPVTVTEPEVVEPVIPESTEGVPATPEGEPEATAAEAQPEGGEVPSGETPAAATPEAETIDYKAAYEQIFGRPIKAGGKEITLKSVEEAVQLVQMGVGFHKNSAKLAQHKRIIETLKEHELLDESKINELIDISKKNPEAIAALVQSAGLEPHQLIPSGDAPKYTPGNHVLPAEQIQFRDVVDTIREEGGTEFLTHVAQDWDVASRAEIYSDPRALSLVHGHKQSGIYDKISSEVERRKVFDPNVASLPFIHAYLAVGNEMHEKGLLVPQQEQPSTPPVTVPVAPVVVKPAVASQPVAPNPAAARAASVRSTPSPATATPNYLTMSDEEFKKHHMP